MILGTPFELAFLTLIGKNKDDEKLGIIKKDAYHDLKKITGQDFGYDPIAWLEYGIQEDFCVFLRQDYLAEFKKWWNENKDEDNISRTNNMQNSPW